MNHIADILLSFSGPFPYLIIFGILLACGLGLPIPEDVTLIAAGLVSYWGLTDLLSIIVISYTGVLLGDTIMFLLGASLGRKLTQKWLFRKLLPEDRLNAMQTRLKTKGNRLIFTARFMPGLRAPIFFSAGCLHVPFRVFLFYDGLAALLSVPAIVGAVYYFGDEFDRVVRVIEKAEQGILLVIGVGILLIFAKWYLTHRRLKRS